MRGNQFIRIFVVLTVVLLAVMLAPPGRADSGGAYIKFETGRGTGETQFELLLDGTSQTLFILGGSDATRLAAEVAEEATRKFGGYTIRVDPTDSTKVLITPADGKRLRSIGFWSLKRPPPADHACFEFHLDPPAPTVGSIRLLSGSATGYYCHSPFSGHVMLRANQESPVYVPTSNGMTSAQIGAALLTELANRGYDAARDAATNEIAIRSTSDGTPVTAITFAPNDAGIAATGAVIAFTKCATGNVNERLGPIEDVLRVNGNPGAPGTRTVRVGLRQSITVSLSRPSAGPQSPGYATWIWTRDAVADEEIPGVGCTANPTPLGAGLSPQPLKCLEGGLGPAYCGSLPRLSSPPRAPWSLTRARGMARPITLTIQGVIQDNSAESGSSVTNAVVLQIQ